MGWISNRRMTTGKGIGGNKKSSKSDAPLRKIIEVIRVADGMFSQDKVLLECGHTTNSNGQYQARCKECKKLKAKAAINQ